MAKQIYQTHGLKTLYLGFCPTVIRESLGLACYFGTYEYLIQHFRTDGKVNLLGSLVCGGIAGMAFWVPTYPIDYIKTLMQGDSLTERKYSGMWDCFAKNKHRGVPVFFTGFGLMMVRSLVANSFAFMAFEVGKRMVY